MGLEIRFFGLRASYKGMGPFFLWLHQDRVCATSRVRLRYFFLCLFFFCCCSVAGWPAGEAVGGRGDHRQRGGGPPQGYRQERCPGGRAWALQTRSGGQSQINP